MSRRATICCGMVVTLALLGEIGVRASEPPPRWAHDELVEVEVVEVEVRVSDRRGRPLTGLAEEDFRVTEDGRSVEIVGFRVIESVGAPEGGAGPLAPAGPGAASHGEPEALDAWRGAGGTLVLFFDLPHLRPGQLGRMREVVAGFVEREFAHDQVLLAYHDGALRLSGGPAGDLDEVLQGLEALAARSGVGGRLERDRRSAYRAMYEALRCARTPEPVCEECWRRAEAVAAEHAAHVADSVEQTLGSLHVLLRTLSGVPGPKTVVFVSDGLRVRPGLELFDYLSQLCPDQEPEIARNYLAYDAVPAFGRLTSLAGAHQATLYAVETRGLENAASVEDDFFSLGGPVTRPSSRNRQVVRTNRQGSLHLLTEPTGGLALLNFNDLDEAFRRLREDRETGYVLAYRPDHPACGRQHDIAVSVARSRHVRHRQHYLHQVADGRLVGALYAAILLELETNPLEVELSFGPPIPAPAGKLKVPLRVSVPLTGLALVPEGEELAGELRFVVTGVTSSGEWLPLKEQPASVESAPEALESDEARRLFVTYIDLAPGDWRLGIAVQDRRGERASYLATDLTVPPRDGPQG